MILALARHDGGREAPARVISSISAAVPWPTAKPAADPAVLLR